MNKIINCTPNSSNLENKIFVNLSLFTYEHVKYGQHTFVYLLNLRINWVIKIRATAHIFPLHNLSLIFQCNIQKSNWVIL